MERCCGNFYLFEGMGINSQLGLVETILPLLGARRWILVRAPTNTSGFVTSDHPVVLQWSEQKDRGFFSSPGFGLRGTEVIFPISYDLAVIGVFDGSTEGVDATPDLVAMINGTIITLSNRQVYARDNRFQYSLSPGVIR